MGMADYIFIRKSRNIVSSFLHVILNILLAIASIGATLITGNCIIGLILVVISKWRIFAVNHRYWLLNIRSSLVDFIVGISFVLLAYAAGTTLLPVHIALIVAYACWLIFIKPRSSLNFNILQSIIATVLGITTASIFAAITNDLVIVIASFIIGYAASNHVLVQNGEHDAGFISLICALIFGETAWLSYSWLIIYTIGNTGICLSQLSLILAVVAYAYLQVQVELDKHGNKLKFSHIALPVLFGILVIVVLVIGFSQPRFNIH